MRILPKLSKLSKKHYIQFSLAILLTLLCLGLTLYPQQKHSVILSFDATTEKNIEWQIFFAEKPDHSFGEKHSIRKNTPAGNNHIKVFLPIKRIVRFRLDLGQYPGKVKIADMKLEGAKTLLLNNLSSFKLYNIDQKADNNGTFEFSSEHGDPYIVYNKELNLRGKFYIGNIDCMFLIICCVLYFLLTYKLIGYLASFKLQGQYSRIDIVFLAVFFVLLFIPMANISNEKESKFERRPLHGAPLFIINHNINLAYGGLFNAWFSDHFLGRKQLIYLYHYLRNLVEPNARNHAAMVGKDGQLYCLFFETMEIYQNTNLFTSEQLDTIGKRISKFVESAKKFGVKQVYFLFDNDKETFYPEFYPDYINKIGSTSRLEQLLGYLNQHYPEIKFFNFKKQFEPLRKREMLFCKTGTHMNSIGAFYQYTFLINQIKKDFPELVPLTLNDFEISEEYICDDDTYKLLVALPWYSKENFKNKQLIQKHINASRKTQKLNHLHVLHSSQNDAVNNSLSLFSLHDSFLDRYFPFLAENFASTFDMFYGGGEDFKFLPEIKEYLKNNVPDIMLIQSTERFLNRFLNLEFADDLLAGDGHQSEN